MNEECYALLIFVCYCLTKITFNYMIPHVETIAVLKLDDELEYLENLVKENKKNNTKKYNENKLRYIPKADIKMMREDRYEKTGNKNQKKYK